MVRVYTGNRLETLSKAASDIIKGSKCDLFDQQIIVVQSAGMRRWLSMQIAANLSICTGIRFLFPNVFAQEVFDLFLGKSTKNTFFDKDTCTFTLMELLPRFLDKKEFRQVKNYIADDLDGLKLFQLSHTIAETFDQYIVFRPNLIAKWEAGKESHWQAELWRALFNQDSGYYHIARLRQNFFDKIRGADFKPPNIPSSIFIFGISSLPPFYIDIFYALSKFTEVNFFIMNPCSEYWFDILTEKQSLQLSRKMPKVSADRLHIEKGNRLLGSMGTLGKELFSMLVDIDADIIDLFEENPPNTLLASIQKDILQMQETKIDCQKDTSLQIHSCSSCLREIEILHDNLLYLLDKNKELEPKDIIVMAPDIGLYAPFIRAVFESPERNLIPFSVSDISEKKQSRAAEAFFAILKLKELRLSASKITDILDISVIRERFGIKEDDLEIIRKWVKQSGIRWGLNSKARENMGLPGFDENTWQAGIQRLLLGYALRNEPGSMFNDILPYDDIEGTQAEVLGRFLDFLDLVFKCPDIFSKPKTLSQWAKTLISIIDSFIRSFDDMENEVLTLKEKIYDLVLKEKTSGFKEKIDIQTIESYLDKQFTAQEHGFISRGVTFCRMLPMRSIPAKAICMIGLNNDNFPRDTYRPGFDLITDDLRAGDRSKRKDDKYMFLEAIISARLCLYISFIGQNKNNSSIVPPASVVSELIEYIEEFKGIAADKLIIRHKITPFSIDYFSAKSDLFSFSKSDFDAAADLCKPSKQSAVLSLNLLPVKINTLTIEDLCRFWKNPVQTFFEKRLGIYPQKDQPQIQETENFNPDELEKYKIEQDIIQNILDKNQSIAAEQRAKGRLPYGSIGQVFFNEIWGEADYFIRQIEQYRQASTNEPVEIEPVEIKIERYRLSAVLKDIYKTGQVLFRYASQKPKDLLYAWIYHLAFCASGNINQEKTTIFLCKDKSFSYNFADKSKEILKYLISLFEDGMTRPLYFFPQTSYEYADTLIRKEKKRWEALSAAKKKWEGTDYSKDKSNGSFYSKGESKEPFYKICFKDELPLNKEFEGISREVFEPIFKHINYFKS